MKPLMTKRFVKTRYEEYESKSPVNKEVLWLCASALQSLFPSIKGKSVISLSLFLNPFPRAIPIYLRYSKCELKWGKTPSCRGLLDSSVERLLARKLGLVSKNRRGELLSKKNARQKIWLSCKFIQ